MDYANDQSVNGIIQVNWNQVVTGTPESMSRKIRPSMVLDSLVTRLVRRKHSHSWSRTARRRSIIVKSLSGIRKSSVGITLEQVKGELEASGWWISAMTTRNS